MRTPSFALLVWLSLAAPTASQAPASALVGIWEGSWTRFQAGSCTVAGQQKSVSPVRLVIRLDDKGEVVAGLTLLPAAADSEGNVSIRVDKKRIFMDQKVMAQCGENFARKYVVKHEIGASVTPDGRRMLRLVGMDVPCIQAGCRFQNLFELEFKGDPPPGP